MEIFLPLFYHSARGGASAPSGRLVPPLRRRAQGERPRRGVGGAAGVRTSRQSQGRDTSGKHRTLFGGKTADTRAERWATPPCKTLQTQQFF